jgi:hypothetical protein
VIKVFSCWSCRIDGRKLDGSGALRLVALTADSTAGVGV